MNLHRTLLVSLPAGALVACATPTVHMPPEVAQSRLQQLQTSLTSLPDGGTATWRTDERHRGMITVDSTFQKGDRLCRLVQEDDRVNGQGRTQIATYCREGKGAWR